MGSGTVFIVNKLQELNATVTGIVSAPTITNYPLGDLSQGDLPMVLTIPDQMGNSYVKGIGLKGVYSSFTVIVLVKHLIDGIGTEYWELSCNLLDRFRKLYIETTYLQQPAVNTNEIALTHPKQINDSGLQIPYTFNGTEYLGFSLTIPVHEKGDSFNV